MTFTFDISSYDADAFSIDASALDLSTETDFDIDVDLSGLDLGNDEILFEPTENSYYVTATDGFASAGLSLSASGSGSISLSGSVSAYVGPDGSSSAEVSGEVVSNGESFGFFETASSTPTEPVEVIEIDTTTWAVDWDLSL